MISRIRHTTDDPWFARYWLAVTISFFGSRVTSLALPLTAVLVLQATPAEMGRLTASANLPFLFFGLLAGVWVDRFRRRPLLIAADLMQAALICTVPVAALLGVLRIEHLYVLSFLLGTIGVVATVAFQSFVATLVRRDRLVEGNSRIELSTADRKYGPHRGGRRVCGARREAGCVAELRARRSNAATRRAAPAECDRIYGSQYLATR